MKKVLTIGGSTQDIYLHYEGADFMSITQKSCSQNFMLFQSGAKIEVEDLLYFTGGGSTNSATSFKRMGFDTTCFCKIGNDEAGKAILDDLKKEGVNTSNITTSKEHSSGKSFIVNSLHKERTIFAYRGVNGFLQESEIPYDQIKNSDQIYITSLSYNSANLLPQIVDFAHKNNVQVAINPGISQLAKGAMKLKESLKNIDTFILNSDEAKTFMISLVQGNQDYKKAFKSSIEKPKKIELAEGAPHLLESPFPYEDYYFSIWKFFKEILKIGPKVVVITDGKNGVYIGTKDEIIFHPSMKTKVVDTLGAGDSFGSCFVASLMHNYSIKDALRNGVINSASVIGKLGAKPGLLTYDKLKTRVKELSESLIQSFEPTK